MKSNLAAIAVGLGISIVGWILTRVFENYGMTLFLGVPSASGCVIVLLAEWLDLKRPGELFVLVLKTAVVSLAWMLLMGVDGLICLLMALPVYMVFGIIGACVGCVLAKMLKAGWKRFACMVILLLGILLFGGFENQYTRQPTIYQVTTRIPIAASPENVWRHVIDFSPIPEPKDWLFRLGIAYPTHAVLKHNGEQWVRECHFSTGAFIEPITDWEEPYRLAFDVAS